MADEEKVKVAIIGSGMAGLVTAWLLKQDPKDRYDVEVFESGSEPSLDYASVSVVNSRTGKAERVDVPMRAFTEGYYHNLKAMYDKLGVRYRVQPFLFSFSRLIGGEAFQLDQQEEKQYFIHASNNHRFPPIKPHSSGLVMYLIELLVVIICYSWFSLCCLIVHTQENQGSQVCESFGEYLERIRLPRYFVQYYLLPLFSAVTTCPHKDLLGFPAKDIVEYKKCITSGRQLTVSAGIQEVQHKLLKNIKIHCSTRVLAVNPQSSRITVKWQEILESGNLVSTHKEFDRVVLAVPPNVVGSIFEPLQKEMKKFPTALVETVVHYDTKGIGGLSQSISDRSRPSWLTTSDAGNAHVIHLRTTRGPDACTEATHIQPSGMMVTSCPLVRREPAKVIRTSGFTRVLRTPDSRRRVNRIFGISNQDSCAEEKVSSWRNGDDGVYLVGSWCWDGMVLLEGCIVSAVRTASALGVQIPWDRKP